MGNDGTSEIINNKNIIKMFKYIRKHKWQLFYKNLENLNEKELNFRDSNKNYFLTYAIRFNKYECVKKILEKGGRFNILNKNGKTILYDAIEFNFKNIIKLIIDFSENEIVNIQNKDKNISLHDAIQFNNIYAVKLLIEAKSNLLLRDNNNNNALHNAVLSGNTEISKYIINVMDTKSLNIYNSKGENALIISGIYNYSDIIISLIEKKANINVVSEDTNKNIIFNMIEWNNATIFDYLLKNDIETNIQDNEGNTPLGVALNENNYYFFKKLLTKANNLNLWNIDGNIPLHIALINFDKENYNYITSLVEESDLLMQNLYGKSCFYYFVEYDIWEKYADVFVKKRIDIFSNTYSNHSPIKILKKNHDKFLEMTVSSYINQLANGVDWVDDYDIKCYNLIKNNDVDGARLIIKKILNDHIILHKENKGFFKSYPINRQEKTFKIDIDLGEQNNLCVFDGGDIDSFFSLFYLIKKFKSLCSIIDKDFTGKVKRHNDIFDKYFILNFKWEKNKLIVTDNLKNNFLRCLKANKRYIIVSVVIKIDKGTHNHQNYLLYDNEIKEIERFEPHGYIADFNYNYKDLDLQLERVFKSIDSTIVYISPKLYLPKISFQFFESNEINCRYYGDPYGFCIIWCIWFIEQRITYSNIDRKILTDQLIKNIIAKGIKFKTIIRNYSKNIIVERDSILKKLNLTYNDWNNDNYDPNIFAKYIVDIFNEIDCCN